MKKKYTMLSLEKLDDAIQREVLLTIIKDSIAKLLKARKYRQYERESQYTQLMIESLNAADSLELCERGNFERALNWHLICQYKIELDTAYPKENYGFNTLVKYTVYDHKKDMHRDIATK